MLFFVGFFYSLLYATYENSQMLSTEFEGRNLVLQGSIISLPYIKDTRTIFLFKVKKLNNQKVNKIFKLSWQEAPLILHAGENWNLWVRVKRIHTLLNPGSFDYEAWRLQNGIHAQGYVLKFPPAYKLPSSRIKHFMLLFRECIKNKIESLHLKSPWVMALAIGERYAVRQEEWAILRNTGTNHLMAIAGLHIGFMSAFIYRMVVFVWKCFPRGCLKISAPQIGGSVAFVIMLLYSGLAGFSIPTQRASIMLSIFLIGTIFKKKILAAQAYPWALFFVLLMNPFSVLSESFWLSFASVAFIIYGLDGRLHPLSFWKKYARIQWVLTLGLIPLGIWFFYQCSLISIIANSIAIPVIGLLIVPLTLIGVLILLLSKTLGTFLLTIADKILGVLLHILTYLSHLSWATWSQTLPTLWTLFAASLAIAIILLPKGFPGRLLGVIGIFPLLFYQASFPQDKEVWLTLLDVGQGLSAVIQTTHHILLYDTGLKFKDYNMGESVILPFLQSLSVKKIDTLVISHGDNDHIGGAETILTSVAVEKIITSVPDKFIHQNTSLCLNGTGWQWDGVEFTFLYPTQNNLGLGNDSSCVLLVRTGSHAILLSGDIEKFAENYLVTEFGRKLKADILVAPHHGSKTSAVPEFINLVNPQFIIFPVGYRNRYHFPHPTVVREYQKRHVTLLDSVHSGAIHMRLTERGIKAVNAYRVEHHRYWQD